MPLAAAIPRHFRLSADTLKVRIMPRRPANTPAPPVTMEDLSVRQAAFVREYVERGGRRGSAADAALAAGYAPSGDRDAARVRASELLSNPKVLAVLRDELTRKLNAAAALGVDVLIELAESGPPQVRLSAARELVDRGYGPVMSRNAHIHATASSIEDIISQLDAEDDRDVIDADFSEPE